MASKKQSAKQPAKRRGAAAAPAVDAKTKAPAAKTTKKGAQTIDEQVRELMAKADKKNTTTSVILADGADAIWSKPRYFISSQSLALNKAMGVPGYPSGKVIEIYGPNSVGKSTVLDHAIAETHARGGWAVLGDTEHARDEKYMSTIGVRKDRLIHVNIKTIESVFSTMREYLPELRRMLGPDVPLLFAWDSVGGTPTIAEMKADEGDKFRAEAAKVLRQSLRVATQLIAETQTVTIFCNQVYKQLTGGAYSEGHDTYGGDAIKFHASLRLDLFPVGRIYPRGSSKDDRAPPVGQIVSCRVVKNKLAIPHRQRRFAISFGQGIDNGWSLFNDFADADHKIKVEHPAIEQSGSWYSIAPRLGKYSPWQGGHWGLAERVHEHPELWDKLVAEYEALP